MRPDYCPLWNEPCQKGCDPKCGTMNAWEALRKENERLRARVAELEPDANAFRAMVNLQMYIGFRQGTVEAFSDGILAASVFNLGHDALSAARNAIADHATALNECSKKADDALAKDGA